MEFSTGFLNKLLDSAVKYYNTDNDVDIIPNKLSNIKIAIEKFSDALEAPLNNAIDNFFDSGEFNQKAAEMGCSMSLVDMIKSINPNFVGDATEYLASKPADYLTSLMSE